MEVVAETLPATPKKLDHNQLIQEIKDGNQQSFRSLYNRYAPLFKGIAYRYVGCADVSNDMIQETFVKIYKNLHTFSFKGSFEGWMKRILVNCCLEYVSKQKKIIFEPDSVLADQSVSNWELPVSEMSAQEIVDLINQLPDGYRMVFNLNVLEGYSHKEIGEHLGISESASRSQLTKAKQKLRDLLKTIRIYSAAR